MIVKAYDNRERDKRKKRDELSKTIDKDKIRARVMADKFRHSQISAIEREEAQGKMTVGMRNEKAKVNLYRCFQLQLLMELKSVSKVETKMNPAFKKRVLYFI